MASQLYVEVVLSCQRLSLELPPTPKAALVKPRTSSGRSSFSHDGLTAVTRKSTVREFKVSDVRFEGSRSHAVLAQPILERRKVSHLAYARQLSVAWKTLDS